MTKKKTVPKKGMTNIDKKVLLGVGKAKKQRGKRIQRYDSMALRFGVSSYPELDDISKATGIAKNKTSYRLQKLKKQGYLKTKRISWDIGWEYTDKGKKEVKRLKRIKRRKRYK